MNKINFYLAEKMNLLLLSGATQRTAQRLNIIVPPENYNNFLEVL